MATALSNLFRGHEKDEFCFYCLVAECGKTIKVSKSNKLSNLKRHMSLYHPTIDYNAEWKSSQNKEYYQMKKRDLIHACVELVTVNGRPLFALDDSGFQKIIEPLLSELNAAGCPVTISSHSIKPYITEMAQKLKKKLATEMQGRLLSVMADAATKNHRGILGINVQYLDNGRTVLRTLGMVEMHERHTGETIADLIKQNLLSYGIAMNQIHSFTSDNARVMLKSARLLNEHATSDQPSVCYSDEDVEIVSDSDDDIEILSDSDDDIHVVSSNEAPFENFGRTVADIFKLENPSLHYITGVRCAAHSLQTAIEDALKASNSNMLIRICRGVVKALRTPNILIELKKQNGNVPVLDVKTRWNSSYFMVCTFLFFMHISICSFGRNTL